MDIIHSNCCSVNDYDLKFIFIQEISFFRYIFGLLNISFSTIFINLLFDIVYWSEYHPKPGIFNIFLCLETKIPMMGTCERLFHYIKDHIFL